MRAVLGMIGLLVALAVVGILAARQLGATRASVGAVASPSGAGASAPANVREASQRLGQRVRDDVARSLEQGAARPETDGQ